MAAATAMANRHIVSTVLRHLSDMKYKDRRQYGPDQPVEFLEFRPTLVPSILVNRLWADEGTNLLWKRYPHLPALKEMSLERRQYYARKVYQVFTLSPPVEQAETLDYLDGLEWPNLKSLELEVDFQRHGDKFASMLHAGLDHLELSGSQSGDSKYFAETTLPLLFNSCKNIKSITIGPDTISVDDPIHTSSLFQYLDSTLSIKTIQVKSTNFVDKDALFARLSQRSDLEGLEIDLDPGLALLPLLSGVNALSSPFSSLRRAWIMCYPEVALALPVRLHLIEELQFDIARVPDQPVRDSDYTIFDDLILQLSSCPHLRLLRVSVSLIAENFPSASSLPILSGPSLIKIAEACPKLEDINLLATEPSAIDASRISSEDFDGFCQALPNLRNLNLKLHPTTATSVGREALFSLGRHCPKLEVLRLKLPFQLSALPVPDIVPQILTMSSKAPELSASEEPLSINEVVSSSSELSMVPPRSSHLEEASDQGPAPPVLPLFPQLTHLAISRPDTALASASDSFTVSSASHSTSEIVDPDLEEDLVRSWAHPLLIHFPRLEILEAWGDWTGRDNESLNYFLPTEEILASTWEFLSGVEQDLWEDGVLEEGDSWDTLDSSEDWEKASVMNEYMVNESGMEKLTYYEEEPEGMTTPGRTLEKEPLQEP